AGGKWWREKFLIIKGQGDAESDSVIDDHAEAAEHTRPSLARALRVLSVCLVLWWAPVLLAALWLGRDPTLLREGVFLRKAARVGALMTTSTTFVPCFLWICLGAPHIEQRRGNERLSTALSAITAAVVGVILHLAVWFALRVLFPAPHTIDWFSVAVSVLAFA